MRFSIDGDDGSLTTRMRNLLEDAGFSKIGTSAYEHVSISAIDLSSVMGRFWIAVGDPTALFPNANFPPGVSFDHIWTYVGGV